MGGRWPGCQGKAECSQAGRSEVTCVQDLEAMSTVAWRNDAVVGAVEGRGKSVRSARVGSVLTALRTARSTEASQVGKVPPCFLPFWHFLPYCLQSCWRKWLSGEGEFGWERIG